MTLTDLAAPSVRSSRRDGLPIVVIGAGPVGLAAAAHLVGRGEDLVVLEAGSRPAAAIAGWGHVRLFSPWRHLVDRGARRLLEATGWQAPDDDALPTGAELVERYLAPLAALPALASRIRFDTRVVAVTREGRDRTRSADRAGTPFTVRVATEDGVQELSARAVIDASGTWGSPNPLGAGGLDPLGLDAVGDRVTPPLPDVLGADRERFARRRVAVVGSGHSAANTLIALAELAEEEPGTEIVWILRTPAAARITASPADELPARASLGMRVEALVRAGVVQRRDGFEIVRLETMTDGRVRLVGRREESAEVDLIVPATGFRPDLGMLRELRLELDEIVEAPKLLAPLIDPNVHTCGTVEPHGVAELAHPEPDFFVVGMKSYGRAPTFLLATGYEQVRSIVAWLSGDLAAARSVELRLPATGVCSTDLAGVGPGAASCCS